MPYVVQPLSENTLVVGEKIFVVSHGWHTGLIIPARLIQSDIPQLKERFSDTPYLEFGWGDKGFYESKEITSGLTVDAMFWPTPSVIHVVAVPIDPSNYFPKSEVVSLYLTGREYVTLVRYIENSFERVSNGMVVGIRPGIYGDSEFYQGVGKYYLFNTCNKWTAKGLRSAGLELIPTFMLTATSVMDVVAQDRHAHEVLFAVSAVLPK